MEALGEDFGRSWPYVGLSWAILIISWALLGDLGVKLGTSWQHVGTKMAKDGLRWPTYVEKGHDQGKVRRLPRPFERARRTPWNH